MQKRGNAELYVFLAFAVIATVGLTYTMLSGTTGMAYHGGPYNEMPLNPTQFPAGPEEYADGLIPIQDQPGAIRLPMLNCQSTCFGRPEGVPRYQYRSYAQPMGGEALRQCLSDCQSGITYDQQMEQECYTCSDTAHGITADNEAQARIVCKKIGGSSAQITNRVNGPCKYS